MDFTSVASFWYCSLDCMLRGKDYILQSLPTNFELHRLRMLSVMEFCLSRSSLFHQQWPPGCFNCRQINSINILDPNTCYTAEITPVFHQNLIKKLLLVNLLVCPAYDPHESRTYSVSFLRHCPIHFHYCPLLTAHYYIITAQKWFCACVQGTLSTRPQAITIQIDPVVAGYRYYSV